jgi:hypothetical protein
VARRRGSRPLVVGRHRYLWSHTHAHERAAGGYRDCREVLTIRRDGSPGLLDVVFHAGPDHLVPDGLLHRGAVRRPDGRVLNLNEPGVVRALLDRALAGGWRPDQPGRVRLDGWPLADAGSR